MTDVDPLDSLLNRVHCLDWRDLMARLPDKSIDAIISDLPYGTTSCHWDTVIPFAPMWDAVKRILKPRGVFVTTASQPFTSALVMSNPKWFRYCWYYEKSRGKNFQQTQFRPLMVVEDVVVFSPSIATYSTTAQPMKYYPQMIKLDNPYKRDFAGNVTHTKSATAHIWSDTLQSKVYTHLQPRNLLYGFTDGDDDRLHPTQKPVALYDYLIRTYTQPGEIVLDFCAGSGTTALAARQTGRRFIIGDSSPEYCAIAQKRLDAPYTLPMMGLLEG